MALDLKCLYLDKPRRKWLCEGFQWEREDVRTRMFFFLGIFLISLRSGEESTIATGS